MSNEKNSPNNVSGTEKLKAIDPEPVIAFVKDWLEANGYDVSDKSTQNIYVDIQGFNGRWHMGLSVGGL